MIKLGVIGACGRMGSGIVRDILKDEQVKLVAAVDGPGHPDQGKEVAPGLALTSDVAAAKDVDVWIDFSSLKALERNLPVIVSAGQKIVIGTTGLEAAHHALLKDAAKHVACLLAPNMSIGVNLLFKIVGEVARRLGPDYDLEIIEKHHRLKKDSPSGTAVGLAQALCAATNRSYEEDVVHGREGMVGERTQKEIGMHAVRGGDIVGEHTVVYAGPAESIEITHRAQSRDVFIRGAIRAAKWLSNKKSGLYSMQDVLEQI